MFQRGKGVNSAGEKAVACLSAVAVARFVLLPLLYPSKKEVYGG